MAHQLKALRVYVDTSVIGGCFDEEFMEASHGLISVAKAGDVRLVVSDTTLAELSGAPEPVRAIILELPTACVEYIEQNIETEALSMEYVRQKVVSVRMLADAMHIAAATVARVDVLVSWNFKHIVNLDRIRGFNAVNLRAGYPTLEIRSPSEIMNYENEDL